MRKISRNYSANKFVSSNNILVLLLSNDILLLLLLVSSTTVWSEGEYDHRESSCSSES